MAARSANRLVGQCAALFLGALAGPCFALTCHDYASLAASAAVYRDAGIGEQALVEMVPTVIVNSLREGERVTMDEIDMAQEMVRAVHRSRMTAKKAAESIFGRCMGART